MHVIGIPFFNLAENRGQGCDDVFAGFERGDG
jgi:hypothetical protein